jgi:hypothetical protein
VKRRRGAADRPATKPSMFVGSSSEGRSVAQQLQRGLAHVAKCRLWTQGVFELSESTLSSLLEATRSADFAVLILTADDLLTKRGQHTRVPRDNVLLELGLFMGAIGHQRTFIVHNRADKIELPSDLAGITAATYSADTDDELEVALGEVCTKLERAMQRTLGNTRELTGRWHERYQRHGVRRGQWVTDMSRVWVQRPGKLSFRSFGNRSGEGYEAVGEFHGEREMVGVWRETQPGAAAAGTFHLYIDPFGKMLYGVCTGPGGDGQMIYSGWILARDRTSLKRAHRALVDSMLVKRRQAVTKGS